MKKILSFILAGSFFSLSATGQIVKYNSDISEISRLVQYFENKPASFFQQTIAKDSIIYFINNNDRIKSNIEIRKIDIQKILFNRILLSLELFFKEDEIESYAYDSIYGRVPFLKKIYKLYLNYPEKNINSFSSQEGVALMYQEELYLYFCDKREYLENIDFLLNSIHRFSINNNKKKYTRK